MEKKKIIIIDDEEDFCFLLSNILESSGYFQVSLAYDGESGRKLAVEQKPDLIFLDYIMPRMRGDEVLNLLRKDQRTRNIPIIMTSGLGEAAYVAKIIQKDKTGELDPVLEGRLPLPRDLTKEESSKLAQEWGVEAFLEKPFSKDMLFRVIKNILGNLS